MMEVSMCGAIGRHRALTLTLTLTVDPESVSLNLKGWAIADDDDHIRHISALEPRRIFGNDEVLP